jgi:beta-phosphoglucomutase-like phosphatase (HAD superfamily)
MKLSPHIKGLIFDCDGTLADTMPLHWRAWQMITQRYGLHFPEDRFYSLGGVPARDILKLLAQEQGRSLDHITAAHEKEEAYLTTLSQIEPIHVVVEIAKANHGKIPMAVASGGTEKIISLVLDRLKMRHLFDVVVTSEMVKNQNPRRIFFLKPRGVSVWNRNSAAPTKTPIWECRRFVPPAWKPWMCGSYC